MIAPERRRQKEAKEAKEAKGEGRRGSSGRADIDGQHLINHVDELRAGRGALLAIWLTDKSR